MGIAADRMTCVNAQLVRSLPTELQEKQILEQVTRELVTSELVTSELVTGGLDGRRAGQPVYMAGCPRARQHAS